MFHPSSDILTCVTYNRTSQLWSTAGTVITSLIFTESDLTVICKTYHLSDFSFEARELYPNMNSAFLFEEPKELLNLSEVSILPLAALLFLLLLYSIHLIYFLCLNKSITTRQNLSKQNQYVEYGQVLLSIYLQLYI